LARNNYGFQKRSRELAKKKKKEEKKLRKQGKEGAEGAESPDAAVVETPADGIPADETSAVEMPTEPETPPTGPEEGAIGTDR
jgi:hypothetical protein